METTVYEGQTETTAWSSAIGSEQFFQPCIFGTLSETWDWLTSLYGGLVIYYHNLKFDGIYWIDFFERNHLLKQGTYTDSNGQLRMKKRKELKNREYIYSISNKGMWYTITIKQNYRIIEMRDSLKLLPFKLSEVGKAFDTKHRKLEMDYGNKYPGYTPTLEERKYIENDIYVLQEAMRVMFDEGHDRLTIGSCCMHDFKRRFDRDYYEHLFPNLYEIALPQEYFSSTPHYSYSMGEYILKSYRGAFCYANPRKAGRIIKNGYTLDVTSLYPSVMHSTSHNRYPTGRPRLWKKEPPPFTYDTYNFIRFKTAFDVKPGYLPFIQIKDDWRYKSTMHLSTSALYNPEDGKYHHYTEEGLHTVTLTMCEDEYKLFLEHYNTLYLEILDGMTFDAATGLFDIYINQYFKIKSESKGAKRTLAKLYLNNLYGKFATSPDSSYKLLQMGEDNILHYKTVAEHDKTPGYIPIGSAITAKARVFTIRAAQANIENFCYADTDSIHCEGKVSDAKGVTIADNELCTWKHESDWTEAYYTRQKTYIERIKNDDGTTSLEVKCAGMPDRCKHLLIASIDGGEVLKERIAQIDNGADPTLTDTGIKELDRLGKLTEPEIDFLRTPRRLTDFKVGITIPSKLYSKIIPGGTLLYPDYYQMRR